MGERNRGPDREADRQTDQRPDDIPPERLDDIPSEHPDDVPPERPDDTSSARTDCLCPVDGVIDLLSRRYAIQVVCAVDQLQPARYGDIADAFGDVSSSTLSTRLEELTEAGLLERERYDEIPPRVEYRLSQDGAELGELLAPVLQWLAEREPPGHT